MSLARRIINSHKKGGEYSELDSISSIEDTLEIEEDNKVIKINKHDESMIKRKVLQF